MSEPKPLTDNEWRKALEDAGAVAARREVDPHWKSCRELQEMIGGSPTHLQAKLNRWCKAGIWERKKDWRECGSFWRQVFVYRPAEEKDG